MRCGKGREDCAVVMIMWTFNVFFRGHLDRQYPFYCSIFCFNVTERPNRQNPQSDGDTIQRGTSVLHLARARMRLTAPLRAVAIKIQDQRDSHGSNFSSVSQ